MSIRTFVLVTLGAVVCLGRPAFGQAVHPTSRPVGIRGFVEAGPAWFTARQSFETITASSGTTVLGAGVQLTNLWRGLFAQLELSRATMTGERVFLHDGNVYSLGIPVEITMMPLEATGGYRFTVARGRLWPYVGAGFGSFAYREESPFASAGEDVDERFRSWHLVSGVEIPVVKWVAAGLEVQYRSVPDALGGGGVSATFAERDLGGTSVRARVVIGH